MGELQIHRQALGTSPTASSWSRPRTPQSGENSRTKVENVEADSTGIRGVHLESIKIGGTSYTSKEAIQRFSDRISGSTNPTIPEYMPPVSGKNLELPDITGLAVSRTLLRSTPPE